MVGGHFEDLLMVELEVMRQHLQSLEHRLIEEYRRALCGTAASSHLEGVDAAVQALKCDVVDATSIGVPKVSDHMVCTSVDSESGIQDTLLESEDSDGFDVGGQEARKVVRSRGADAPVQAQSTAWPPSHAPPTMRVRGVDTPAPVLGFSNHDTTSLIVRSPLGSRNGTPAASPRNSFSQKGGQPILPVANDASAASNQSESEPDMSPRQSLGDAVCRVESWKGRNELKPSDRPNSARPLACKSSPSGRSSLTSLNGVDRGRVLAMQRARASMSDGQDYDELEEQMRTAVPENTYNAISEHSIEDMPCPPSNVSSRRPTRHSLLNPQEVLKDPESGENVEVVTQELRISQTVCEHVEVASVEEDPGTISRNFSSPGDCPLSRSPSPGADDERPGMRLLDPTASRRSSDSAGSGMSAQTAITQITTLGGTKADKHDFQLLEAWTDEASRQTFFGMSTAARTQPVHLQRRTSRRSICQADAGAIWEGFEEAPGWYQYVQSIMVSPSSHLHLGWDLAAGILIIFDVLVLPLQMLDPPNVLVVTIMCMIVRLFWTMDFIAAFLTGYIDNQGETIMSPYQVARRYAATWMLPDFFSVVCDWAEVIVKGSPAYGGTGYPQTAGVFSALRLTRVLRLIRLTKAREVTEFIIEHVQSENIILIADILKIVALMLALTHVIACAWYGVGKHGPSMLRSWVKSRRLEEEILLERYIWSFHCAMAFWTGEHIVDPTNSVERVFVSFLLIVTFMLSVWFVSCMTTAMTRLQIIAGQNSVQFSALSRYLSAKKISQELSAKVLRNAQFAMEQRKSNADENNIDLLHLVSEPLRTELHYEVFSPILFIHPFFRAFNSVNAAGIRKVCHVTLSRLDFSRGDIVFTEEVPVAPKMFFIQRGILLYVQERTRQRRVSCKNWLAEMVLWTTWGHRGTLHAASDCQLLAMDANKFISVISKFPGNQVVQYANAFVAHLRQQEGFELTDIGSEDDESSAWILKIANRAFEQEEANRDSTASGSGQRTRSWMKRSQNEKTRGVKFSFNKVIPSNKNSQSNKKHARIRSKTDGDASHAPRQSKVWSPTTSAGERSVQVQFCLGSETSDF